MNWPPRRSLVAGFAALLLAHTTRGAELEDVPALSFEIEAVAQWIWDARQRESGWIVEFSPAFELDLGELGIVDDWYVFANPTLTWGTEESYQLRPRLYQAWLSWDGNEAFNAQFGVLDPSWYFHSLPSTWIFSPLPARTPGQFSPGGLGRLDLFPLSAPGVRLEWKPRPDVYVQTEMNYVGPGWSLDGGDLTRGTSLTIIEAGVRRDPDDATGRGLFRAGLGGWALGCGTALRDDDSTVGGMYAFVDADLRPAPHEFSAFLTTAVTRTIALHCQARVAAGVHATGILSLRPRDESALGAIWEVLPAAGPHATRFAAEAVHRFWLGESFYVQASALWQSETGLDAEGNVWRFGVALGWKY